MLIQVPDPTADSPPAPPSSGDGVAPPSASPGPTPEPELRPAERPAERLPPVAPPAIPIARPASRRFRVARAYAAALRVALSYVAFDAVAWVRGPRWAARHRRRLHARNGRRVRRAFLRLRGLFIKAGQLASALTNFLPEPFREELEGLQDQVPANDFALVQARLRDELGGAPEELFDWISPAPVASASLAQVHRARLGGRDVALKVQHADIEAIAELDLRAIRTILRWAGRWFGIGGLEAQMEEIEAVIRAELDFRQEAAHVAAIGAALAERPGVEVPRVVAERSARRVLTTEWVDAVKAGDLAALDAAGVDRSALAFRILDVYGAMVFADGAYHADPHPGNLLVRPDPAAPDGFALVFLDFGAVATLTPAMREGLAEMIAGTLARDAARVTAALGLMGFIPTSGETDAAVLALIESIHAEVLQGIDPSRFRLGDISLEQSAAQQRAAFDQMREMNVSIRDLAGAFRVPRDWVLLERTALLLVGLATALDAELNPFDAVWRHVEPLAGEAAPGVRRALRDRVVAELQTALALPGRLDRVLTQAETGALVVRSPDALAAADRIAGALRGLTWAVGAVGSGGLAVAVGAGAGAWALGGVAALCGIGALASLRR